MNHPRKELWRTGAFPYPEEVEIDYDKKSINLAWFGDRFYRNAGSNAPQSLDYHLATYCIVKEIHTLAVSKWRELIEPSIQDDDVLATLNIMRSTYLIIYPQQKQKNWSTTVLQYIKKMMSSKKTQAVTILLFMKILGLRMDMTPNEALKFLGANASLKLNAEFAMEDEAKFGLVLPPELKADLILGSF